MTTGQHEGSDTKLYERYKTDLKKIAEEHKSDDFTIVGTFASDIESGESLQNT